MERATVNTKLKTEKIAKLGSNSIAAGLYWLSCRSFYQQLFLAVY